MSESFVRDVPFRELSCTTHHVRWDPGGLLRRKERGTREITTCVSWVVPPRLTNRQRRRVRRPRYRVSLRCECECRTKRRQPRDHPTSEVTVLCALGHRWTVEGWTPRRPDDPTILQWGRHCPIGHDLDARRSFTDTLTCLCPGDTTSVDTRYEGWEGEGETVVSSVSSPFVPASLSSRIVVPTPTGPCCLFLDTPTACPLYPSFHWYRVSPELEDPRSLGGRSRRARRL